MIEDIQRVQRTIEGMKYQSCMLLNLINDLLDFAKVENNSFTIVESYFDLNKLIESAFDTVRYVAD